jgi:ABC-type glycerol-3-phosphate transport system substrate-binding protein
MSWHRQRPGAQAADQAKFFSNPPERYGTHFAGKDEGITGRFYGMLSAEGGQLPNDDMSPSFNSEAGVRALNFFVDRYAANAVPAGTTNHVWDDLGLGFAAGAVAWNLDWAGWAAYFNGADNGFMVEVFSVWGDPMANHAFAPPLIAEWGEISNALWPRLQAALLGDMTAEDALNEAAEEVTQVMEDAGHL